MTLPHPRLAWRSEAHRPGPSTGDFPITDMPRFHRQAPRGLRELPKLRSGRQARPRLPGTQPLLEEHGVDAVTDLRRTAAAAGRKTLISTNACGGIDPDWHPGTPCRRGPHQLHRRCHLRSPLRRPARPLLGPPAPHRQEIQPTLEEDVYIQFPGPMYETAAEITIEACADLVGMSTALEAIVGRSVGMEILGLSLVTNYARHRQASAQPRRGPRRGPGCRRTHERPAGQGHQAA